MHRFTHLAFGTIAAIGMLSSAPMSADDDCCNWYGEADLIVWATETRDTDYGIEVAAFPANTTASLQSSKVLYLSSDWAPGFRLGLGYHLPCDCWDAKLVWTHFYDSSHETSDLTGTGTVILPIPLGPSVTNRSAAVARFSHSLDYNVIDGLVIRDYCPCDCLAVSPFFGIRGVFIKQKFHGYYSGSLLNSQSPALGDGEFKWSSQYNGGGFHAGFQTRYDFGCRWNVFGKVGGSLVAGDNDASQSVTYNTAGTVLSDTDDVNLIVVSNAEAALGIGYDWCICGRDIAISVGYEFIYWWNTPTYRRFYNSVSTGSSESAQRGSLGLHGAFLRLGSSF